MLACATVVSELGCLTALHTNNGSASTKSRNTLKILIKFEGQHMGGSFGPSIQKQVSYENQVQPTMQEGTEFEK